MAPRPAIQSPEGGDKAKREGIRSTHLPEAPASQTFTPQYPGRIAIHICLSALPLLSLEISIFAHPGIRLPQPKQQPVRMDQTQAYVRSSTDTSGICTIEFFHPAHNSLPGEILGKLAEAITVAGEDDSVVVVLLKSGGERTFCAGASFDELVSIDNPARGKAFFLGFANVINACRSCPKLIIGRVQGKAVGGGVGVAAAVDYCMATKFASVKLSELALGIGPFVVGPAVERKVGLAAFSHLTINATEWQTAAWAKEKGLFQEVFDTTEQLDAYLEKFALKLAGMNPEALARLKSIFWEGTRHWETLLEERAAMSGKLVLSDFTRNAIASIKQKTQA